MYHRRRSLYMLDYPFLRTHEKPHKQPQKCIDNQKKRRLPAPKGSSMLCAVCCVHAACIRAGHSMLLLWHSPALHNRRGLACKSVYQMRYAWNYHGVTAHVRVQKIMLHCVSVNTHVYIRASTALVWCELKEDKTCNAASLADWICSPLASPYMHPLWH